jgi:hypothetical protein
LRDDVNRDDEAFRNQIAELIIDVSSVDRKRVYKQLDKIWAAIDPKTIFPITNSINFVKSLSLQELQAAHESLAYVSRMLRHALAISGPVGQVNGVTVPLRLMRDFLGPMVVKALIMVNRTLPDAPLPETISTLHDFVIGVQSIDIPSKDAAGGPISERVRIKWEATQKVLSELWTGEAT